MKENMAKIASNSRRNIDRQLIVIHLLSELIITIKIKHGKATAVDSTKTKCTRKMEKNYNHKS